MTRSGDKYVPLRKRIEIARKNRADLFISVHADANHSSRLHGLMYGAWNARDETQVALTF